MATQKVADRLVELCSAGKNLDAVKELYADDAKSIEVLEAPWCPRVMDGKAAITKRSEEFHKNMTVHGQTVGKPVVNGDQFIVPMSLDATSKEGPMAGMRMDMKETSLYTVKNGKISEAKFFYSCGV